MAGQYTTFNGTATVTPQSQEVKVRSIEYIVNDDEINSLYVSFSNLNVDSDYLEIKPNEKLYGFSDDISVGTLWYKSSASTVAFRFLGSK